MQPQQKQAVFLLKDKPKSISTSLNVSPVQFIIQTG